MRTLQAVMIALVLLTSFAPMNAAAQVAEPSAVDSIAPDTFREFVARKQLWNRLVQDEELFPCYHISDNLVLPSTEGRACSKNKDASMPPSITAAGDSVIFNGLLCYSGDQRGCAAVKASQDPETGRWYRSPLHVGWEDPRTGLNSDGKPVRQTSFSRDAALGVLLYLAVTKDKSAAEKWLGWMQSNAQAPTTNITILRDGIETVADAIDCGLKGVPCVVERAEQAGRDLEDCVNSLFGCLAESVGPFVTQASAESDYPAVSLRVCPDPKNVECDINPGLYALMYDVWVHIGADPTADMIFWKRTGQEFLLGVEAHHTEPGTDLHLKAVHLLTLEAANRGLDLSVLKVLRENQPFNPFFQWVGPGIPDQDIAKTILTDWCTVKTEQEYLDQDSEHTHRDWMWRRKTEERIENDLAEKSMLWDCIFMANLLGIPDVGQFSPETGSYIIYLDADAPNGGDGTFETPYSSVETALTNAPDNSWLVFGPGQFASSLPLVLDRKMTLASRSGSVTLGVPKGPTFGLRPPTPPPALLLSSKDISLVVEENNANLPTDIVVISNGYPGTTLEWSIETSGEWFDVSMTDGTAPSALRLTPKTNELEIGSYTGQLTISAAGALDSPQTVDLSLEVVAEMGHSLFLPMLNR